MTDAVHGRAVTLLIYLSSKKYMTDRILYFMTLLCDERICLLCVRLWTRSLFGSSFFFSVYTLYGPFNSIEADPLARKLRKVVFSGFLLEGRV